MRNCIGAPVAPPFVQRRATVGESGADGERAGKLRIEDDVDEAKK